MGVHERKRQDLDLSSDTPEEAKQWVSAVNDCLSGSNDEEMSNESEELSSRFMTISRVRDFELIERQLVKEFGLRMYEKMQQRSSSWKIHKCFEK